MTRASSALRGVLLAVTLLTACGVSPDDTGDPPTPDADDVLDVASDRADDTANDTADGTRDTSANDTSEDADDAVHDASEEAPRDATTDRADVTADGADATVDRADAAADRTDATVDRADAVTDRADATVDRTDATVDRTDATVDRADATVDRTDASMDAPMDRPDSAMDAGTCPPEMVLVAGRVCVDRWEATLEEIDMDGGVRPWSPYYNPGTRRVRAVSVGGVVPQGYIAGSQAQTACTNAGKRLCALDEWLAACRGPMNRTYPYGNTYVPRRCNEGRTPHPVVEYFGTSVGVFTSENMNNPGINMLPNSLAPTGMFWDCVSPWGIYDMVGNLHEWINDPAGTFKGGFYVDAEINGHGCLYTTTAHSFTYRDYSTGFRCCASPR